jgi:hypothetical protein
MKKVYLGWLLVFMGIPVACDGLALLSVDLLIGIANVAICATIIGGGIILIRSRRAKS